MSKPTNADIILDLARLVDECEDEAHAEPDLDPEYVNREAVETLLHTCGVLRASILVLEDPTLPHCSRLSSLGRTSCERRAHVGRHFDAYHGWDDPPWDIIEGHEERPS